MYPGYGDSLRKQRRYARQHGGEPADGERTQTQSREPEDTQP
jgi:hypothetical protein